MTITWVIIFRLKIGNKRLLNALKNVFSIPIERISLVSFDQTDWEKILLNEPLLICRTLNLVSGDFRLYIEMIFMKPELLNMKHYQAAVRLGEILKSATLIEYKDGIPSHYVIIFGEDNYQHVYVDPDKTLNYDHLEYHISFSKGNLNPDEMDKMSI